MGSEPGNATTSWSEVVGAFVEQHGVVALGAIVLVLAAFAYLAVRSLGALIAARYGVRMEISRGGERKVLEVLPELPRLGSESDRKSEES